MKAALFRTKEDESKAYSHPPSSLLPSPKGPVQPSLIKSSSEHTIIYAARSPTVSAPRCLLFRACHGDFGVDQRRRTDTSGERGRPRSLLRADARVRAARLRGSFALLPTPRRR